MSLSAYDALEATFHEFLRLRAARAVDLPPDTLARMFDDFDGPRARRGWMRYGQGAIVDVGHTTWAIGLGMNHCPERDRRVVADLAAMRIAIPDGQGDPACIAPPPREPHRILSEALVTNECFECSFVIACSDGSIAMPPDSALNNIFSQIFVPRHAPLYMSNTAKMPGAIDPITYIPEFPPFLAAVLGATLLVLSETEIAGCDS